MRGVFEVFRVLALVLIVWGASTPITAQRTPKNRPRYTVGNGRCGPVYMLEDAPDYFEDPKTTQQILHVIRILRSAPPQADVKCRDFTDAWAPYVYTDRKVEIAGLLIKLKRYDEARDELWGLFLRGGVQYNGRMLRYNFGIKDAVSMLMSDKLWNARDVERRLADPRYDFNTDLIREEYERRKRAAPKRRK